MNFKYQTVGNMDILRIGVSARPRPVLSVEFVRGRKLYVWRLEFDPFKFSADEIVKLMKAQYPQYLSEVPSDQLSRLVKHVTLNRAPELREVSSVHEDLNKVDDSKLKKVKSEMEIGFQKNSISKNDKNFVYDLQIDFPTPRGLPFDQ